MTINRRNFLSIVGGLSVQALLAGLLAKGASVEQTPHYAQLGENRIYLPSIHRDQQSVRTRYIAPDGRDSNDGSRSAPWKSLNHKLKPGDTIYFREGRYEQQIVLKQSGEPGRPITVAGYPGESVRIEGVSGKQFIVNVTGRHDITVENLQIQYRPSHKSPGKKWAWVTIRNSERVRLVSLQIKKEIDPLVDYGRGFRESGIEITDSNYVAVGSCTLSGVNKGIGIRNSSQNTHLRQNVISNTSQSCIVVGSSKSQFRGALIEGNVLEKSAIEDGIQFLQDFEAANSAQDTSNRGTTIRNNVIRDNAENAIDLKGASFITIEGNVIYGTVGSSNGNLDQWNRNSLFSIGRGKRAICQDIILRNNVVYDNANGIWVDGHNNKVYHNTLVYNNRDFTGSQSSWREGSAPNFYGLRHQYTDSKNVGIRNNLIGGHTHGGQVALRITSSNSLDIDYNVYFAGNGGAEYLTDYNAPGDWTPHPFSEWQSALRAKNFVSGNDAHSQFVTFREVSFASVPERPTGDHDQYDFRVRPESRAYQTGGPLTKTSSSGRDSNIVRVQDSSWFSDGYGSSLVSGDTVRIGDTVARIVKIDRSDSTLFLERSLSWESETPVYFGVSPTPNVGMMPQDGVQPILMHSHRPTELTMQPSMRADLTA